MKVSVLIPTFNNAGMLKNALKSIPVRDDLEVIIVNDCSSDSTEEVVEEFRKETPLPVKYIRNEFNMKTAMSLNRAFANSSGEYVVQLDDDDLYIPEALSRVIDQADADLVWFDIKVNDGGIWSPNIRKELCDHVCLFKRTIIGESRWANVPNGGGWFLMQEVLKKPHTERYTNELAYLYNFPRVGSVLYNLNKRTS